MFQEMFKKIKKTTKDDASDTVFKSLIATWTLTDIKTYLQNKNPEFPLTEHGLLIVLERFTTREKPSDKYPNGKCEVELDDNDIRIKKAFDIILLVAKSSTLSMEGIEKMEAFREMHTDVIEKFDKNNAQTYEHKLKEAVANAIIMVETKKGIENSLNIRHNTGKKS